MLIHPIIQLAASILCKCRRLQLLVKVWNGGGEWVGWGGALGVFGDRQEGIIPVCVNIRRGYLVAAHTRANWNLQFEQTVGLRTGARRHPKYFTTTMNNHRGSLLLTEKRI